jgi:hypothetical protein
VSKIFLDLDGVIFDFDGTFKRKFGVHPSTFKENKKRMWQTIAAEHNFFSEMDLMPGAEDLWDAAWGAVSQPDPVYVLTACPHSAFAHVAEQKRAGLRKHFSFRNWMMIPTWGSETKPQYMHDKGDILIDDWRKNTEAWEAAGGRAIKYENAEQTIQDLRRMMDA